MDALRDQYFSERGWLVVRVTSHDLRNGFQRVIALVRARAASFNRGSERSL
jgi:very-short-patch-repair endonuclease